MIAENASRVHSSQWQIAVVLFFLWFCPIVAARGPTDGGLRVHPPSIVLNGTRDTVQLLVSIKDADGTIRDVTGAAKFRAALDVATVDETGWVRARRNGGSVLIVEAEKKSIRVPLTVAGCGGDDTVSFRREVVAALNVGGCNQGACHGTPAGKNGFRLSLRGGDPAADYRELTQDLFGRRTSALNPDSSLIFAKGCGTVPHEGGVRWRAGTLPVEIVAQWLSGGCRDDDPALPPLVRIEVSPTSRQLRSPQRDQQLAVRAVFADGSSRDVTRLSVFSVSDAAFADVSESGKIVFRAPGEVAVLVRYLNAMAVSSLSMLEPNPTYRFPDLSERNVVDRAVFARFRQMQIVPAELCTDAEFLRRLSLDLTGALPTPEVARAFILDPTPNKRERAIDRLLDSPAFADFWALKWADVLRAHRKTMQLKGAQGLHGWLRSEIAANTRFDAVVRDLLTASGASAVTPAVNFYRVTRESGSQAEAVAQLFCGVRLQCAKCHNHPSERWTQDDYAGMAAFFARVRSRPDPSFGAPAKDAPPAAEIVSTDRSGEFVQPRNNLPVQPKPLGSSPVPTDGDRRIVLAEWLTRPENPFFARAIANRVWFHLFGRGIVEPVDDFRDSNPPSHPELLDVLAREFVSHQYDLRYLIRLVVNSTTYQLSERKPNPSPNDDKYFARVRPRLLSAEQLLDAASDVTGVPERFAGLPLGVRAVQLPDGDDHHPFLRAFGQPARELPCECERDGEANLTQALQLTAGSTVSAKLREPNNRIGTLIASKKSDPEIVEILVLSALGRIPRPEEIEQARAHIAASGDRRRGLEDVLWAFLNSPEFLFRH